MSLGSAQGSPPVCDEEQPLARQPFPKARVVAAAVTVLPVPVAATRGSCAPTVRANPLSAVVLKRHEDDLNRAQANVYSGSVSSVRERNWSRSNTMKCRPAKSRPRFRDDPVAAETGVLRVHSPRQCQVGGTDVRGRVSTLRWNNQAWRGMR
jgi:hypothetical protein